MPAGFQRGGGCPRIEAVAVQEHRSKRESLRFFLAAEMRHVRSARDPIGPCGDAVGPARHICHPAAKSARRQCCRGLLSLLRSMPSLLSRAHVAIGMICLRSWCQPPALGSRPLLPDLSHLVFHRDCWFQRPSGLIDAQCDCRAPFSMRCARQGETLSVAHLEMHAALPDWQLLTFLTVLCDCSGTGHATAKEQQSAAAGRGAILPLSPPTGEQDGKAV